MKALAVESKLKDFNRIRAFLRNFSPQNLNLIYNHSMIQIIFTIILTLSAWADSSDSLFQQISKHTFRVKTALSPDAAKASYGTGFVVDAKRGRLITNYHVVSSVIQKKDGGYKNYVMLDEVPLEAKVLAVDLIHDLALVEVAHVFSGQIEIRKEEPKQGEKIFSFGIPKDLNLTIVDGLFNGFIKIGPFNTIQMSTPINSGMSGGPTTDSLGRLVGVNVAGMLFSDNITFAVPAKFVQELLVLGDAVPLPMKDFKKLHLELEKQLLKAQQKIIDDFKQSQESTDIGQWHIPSSSKLLKCWMATQNDRIKLNARKIKEISKNCRMEHEVYLDDLHRTIIFDLKALAVENVSLNRFQFSQYVDANFNHPSMKKTDEVIAKERESVQTVFQCENLKLTNKHKVNFLVGFCMRGYYRYPNIVESFLKIAVLDPKAKSTLILGLTIDGFTKENTKLLMKEFIENVHQ
jgi:serine protease Do